MLENQEIVCLIVSSQVCPLGRGYKTYYVLCDDLEGWNRGVRLKREGMYV